MDQQATRLRQLVRQVRQAAIASTGPPLFALVASNKSIDLSAIHQSIRRTATAQGIRVGGAIDRLEEGDRQLEIDWQFVDAGVGYSEDQRSTWEQASAVLVVTTTEDQAILAAYTTLKLASQQTPLPVIEFLLQDNAIGQEGAISEPTLQAYDRLTNTCERFLGCRPAALTVVSPRDSRHGFQELVDRWIAIAPAGETLSRPLAEKAD